MGLKLTSLSITPPQRLPKLNPGLIPFFFTLIIASLMIIAIIIDYSKLNEEKSEANVNISTTTTTIQPTVSDQ